jgi:translation initiation factor 6
MAVSKSDHYGNPFIGIYARASDSYLLAAVNSPPKFVRSLDALGVPPLYTTISNSFLIGLYCAGNNAGLIVCEGFSERERKAIKSAYPDVRLHVCKDKLNAIGNNLVANSHGGIANPGISNAEIKKISDTLGVEVVKMEIAGFHTVGACCAATDKGFVAYNRISEDEMNELESVLHVKGENCTVNTGTPFVPLGILANSKGLVIGSATSGFELSKIMGGLDIE